jgi:hypothetical protein
MFCNSQIILQKCPSEPSSEENEASLLTMKDSIFDCMQDSMELQTRAICEILHHVLEDHHFDILSNSKGYTEPPYNRCSNSKTTEQLSPNSTYRSKENTNPSSPEVTFEKEIPNSTFDSDQKLHPLPIQTLPLPLPKITRTTNS